MSLYTLPNATTGLDGIITQTVSSVPAFTPLLLAFVFFTIFLGGMARQKARVGNADAPMWAVVGSLATLLIAFIMSMTTGIIQLDWLIIVLVITIFSGVWLFLDRRAGDV